MSQNDVTPKMMRVPPVKINFPPIDREQILKEIDGVLQSGMLTLHKHGQEFEQDFAKYLGVKHAIATNGGTASIEAILRILDVQGKDVLVPTNTFFATPAPVIYAGGKVKFLESEEEHFSIDIQSLQENITSNTTAVLLVHVGGFITKNIPEIQKICQDNNVTLIEDASHAHGSSFDDIKAGAFGKAAAFSFYPTKVITTAEGGMVTTNDDEINEITRVLRDQGKAGFYGNVHVKFGYNWRLSELHAILGKSQLKRIDEFIEARNEIANIYNKELKMDERFTVIKPPTNSVCNYYKYMVLINKSFDRQALKKTIREQYKISLTGEVYELPCHLQPVFKDLGYKKGDFPVAEDICSRHICLPIFPGMTEEQALHVINSLKREI